jgi:hypothetical protein
VAHGYGYLHHFVRLWTKLCRCGFGRAQEKFYVATDSLPSHVLEIPDGRVPRVCCMSGDRPGELPSQLAWVRKVFLCLDIGGVRLVSYWGPPKKERGWRSSPERADHVKGQSDQSIGMQNFVWVGIRNSFQATFPPLLDACMGQPGNLSKCKCKQVGMMTRVL